ncbi:bifunctional 3'-5' exonuclease/DNA polymerase [Actinomadura craniellae]|uniref:bifunctional 3'-5' exonuclease/DNA polymerase n=1 Tax=Actinomadura craniellae TaxID=2231787 RepID=UPI0018F1DF6D|nr:bifunctional 3'-5' exonuclease/DNA polymerase [Actinomadura craniellae]
MRIAVAGRAGGGGVLRPLTDEGVPAGPPEPVADLAAAIVAAERAHAPRWVWAATSRVYPAVLDGGRVARAHDLELVEGLLLGHAGRYGEPRSVAAARARLRGAPVPADAGPPDGSVQPALFGGPPDDDLDAIIEVHADQVRRLAAAEEPLGLLAAAESAGGLAAAEMSRHGLPWRVDLHDALLTESLGPRPGPGLRPRRLQELADLIGTAFGGRVPVNPDSPAQLLRAFAATGVSVPSTRAYVLNRVDHPVVPLLLEYKELARLHAAHGWSWLDTWVRDGRFRPEYVVGGVVSGRWASRGGGALQIPRVLRRAVVADPGWALVVADAAQLEPRVLAALAGDRAFAAAASHGDLYSALAEVYGGARAGSDAHAEARGKAKIALLSAMYGGGGGEAGQLLAVLRHRFPTAFEYVEAAARAGEAGRLVRSRLGRTCPPPTAAWRDLTATDDTDRSGSALRGRGRFTRNFVVQASAADWALALLATLRGRLAGLAGRGTAPHLVFFQHDEVIVHTPRDRAEAVADAVRAAGAEAGRLVFGPTPVVFPLEVAVVDCYADAK